MIKYNSSNETYAVGFNDRKRILKYKKGIRLVLTLFIWAFLCNNDIDVHGDDTRILLDKRSDF